MKDRRLTAVFAVVVLLAVGLAAWLLFDSGGQGEAGGVVVPGAARTDLGDDAKTWSKFLFVIAMVGLGLGHGRSGLGLELPDGLRFGLGLRLDGGRRLGLRHLSLPP